MTEQEMLAIARAFAWYPNPSASFDGFQDEQMIERYLLLTTSVMKTYCEIYSLDERAYMMISNESSMTPILQYFRLLWGMLWIVGPARVYRQIERGTEAGICQEVELRKKKIPFIHIELLAVRSEHWGEHLMSEMIAFAKAEARRRGCVCILETDERVKRDKYLHLGFVLRRTRTLREGVAIYDMIYDPKQ
ncbi:GNAT family N-acetyltransferase [uncultured Dubosiella sp.]|uniref:GNAT family N-acetyltransferase n=1 Tax=uncultured Dubosiella sp. TaxID=1937011 RepID=UPI0027295777|nr:GNAT family N-acetyltransferase [uncultured Dubosiella sp.]